MIKFCAGKCRVEVSFWFFAAFSVLSLFDTSGIGIMGMVAALLHESGHICMMRIFGTALRSVSVTPAGVMIESDGFSPNRGWFWIAAGGSSVNLICAAAALGVFPLMPFSARSGCAAFAGANLFIGLINIVPAKGLDGGEILFRLLLRCMPVRRAENAALVVSLACAVPAIAAGLHVLISKPGNFSLLMVGLWLMSGMLREYINI